MKAYCLLLAVGVTTLPSVASAKVVFCNATGRAAPNTRYFTAFVDVGLSEAASSQLGRAFETHLNATHPEGDGWDAHCDTKSSLSSSKSRLSWFKYNNQDDRWIPTDFTGGFPKASGASRDIEAPGPYLMVKKDEGSADAAMALDEAVLQAQRDGAAALAKRIAETARNQASTKAKMDQFIVQLKKRGSAQ